MTRGDSVSFAPMDQTSPSWEEVLPLAFEAVHEFWSEHFREQKQQAADSAIRNQAHFPLSLSGFSALLTLCLNQAGGDRRLWAILRQNWMESESACGPL